MSGLNKTIFIIIVLLAIIFPVKAQSNKNILENFDRQIKVHLGDFDSMAVSCEGELVIECYREDNQQEVFYTSSLIGVTDRTNGIWLQDENGYFAKALIRTVFRPRYPSIFVQVNTRRYRGGLMCIADFPSATTNQIGKMTVFNIVDMEDYIKGVLPGEMGQRNENEIEALKAQAIAARTYAIWKLSEGNSSHLKNTIEDQLYLGAGAEMPLHSRAVEATDGIVMTYRGNAIAAYYYAVCGGSSIPREKAWGGKKLPYLKSVDDDSFCTWPKSYAWKETFTPADLNINLSQYFGSIGQLPIKGFGTITDIHFKEDKGTGRISGMKVETSTGEFKAEGDKIRWALKRPSVPGAILPSTRFTANLIKTGGAISSLEISGTGNGHGVGMCQCGAIGRARDGQTYSEILNTYYKGIKIAKIY
jgi:stage II sporulation protein D